MKSFILLENVELYARHGLFEQETMVGNTFIINLKVEVDVSNACLNDEIAGTVSYAEMYDLIEDEMKTPSKLLEHVAYRIVQRLRSSFSQIGQIELKISKVNPPVRGQVDRASIVLID